MTYTNNVPQANQTIASTTTPIRNNFAFIQNDLQVEHQFNNNNPGQAEGTHIKASMPNVADPVALPAGTNGTYYVGASLPKFYNGTSYFLLAGYTGQFMVKGTVALTNTPANVFTFPANTVGTMYIFNPANATASVCGMGQFITGTTGMTIGDVTSPSLAFSFTGLTLRAAVDVAASGTYTYFLVYYTP